MLVMVHSTYRVGGVYCILDGVGCICCIRYSVEVICCILIDVCGVL